MTEALTTRRDLLAGLEKEFKAYLPRVLSLMPKHVDPERIRMLAYAAVTRSPALQECTAASILRGAIIGAQLGLDVSGIGGEAYLVPFNNRKTGNKEAAFITGYKGMIKLAMRSGVVSMVETCEVYATDNFKVLRGTTPGILHEPSMLADPGPIVGFYAVATHANGMKQFEAMTKTQVDAIRARSKAGDSGPWVTDYPAMGRKTSIRRLANYLPLSAELVVAIESEDRFERGESQNPMIDQQLSPETPSQGPTVGKGARKLAKVAKETVEKSLASTGDESPSDDDPGAGLRDETPPEKSDGREPGQEG